MAIFTEVPDDLKAIEDGLSGCGCDSKFVVANGELWWEGRWVGDAPGDDPMGTTYQAVGEAREAIQACGYTTGESWTEHDYASLDVIERMNTTMSNNETPTQPDAIVSPEPIEPPKPIIGTMPHTFPSLPGVTLILPDGLNISETLRTVAQVSYEMGLRMADVAAEHGRAQALSMISVETQGYEQRAAQEGDDAK